MATVDAMLPGPRTPRDHQLLASDPRADQDVLRELARSPWPFVRIAVATQERADAQALAELRLDDMSGSDRNRTLLLMARHHNADRDVLLRVLTEVQIALDTSARPHAAAIALAGRPELTTAEVASLITSPRASARLRRGLTRALAARPATT